MNWQALSTIAEVIGAIAVVASVIYLAIQVRENTRLSAQRTVSSAIDAFNEFDRLIASTPDLASLLTRGETALSSLSPDEQRRFDHLNSIEFGVYEGWHTKKQTIGIGKEQNDLMESMLGERLSNAGILECGVTTAARIHHRLSIGWTQFAILRVLSRNSERPESKQLTNYKFDFV